LTDGLIYLKNENCSLSSTRNISTSSINVFPNPSKGTIFFEDISINDYRITLRDVTGKQIDFILNGNELNLQNKFVGLVYLELKNEHDCKIAKVLFQ
jgi:hypothetical protein